MIYAKLSLPCFYSFLIIIKIFYFYAICLAFNNSDFKLAFYFYSSSILELINIFKLGYSFNRSSK